jgi:hypothetical protein
VAITRSVIGKINGNKTYNITENVWWPGVKQVTIVQHKPIKYTFFKFIF